MAIGGGAIGQIMLQLLRMSGAEITVLSEPVKEKYQSRRLLCVMLAAVTEALILEEYQNAKDYTENTAYPIALLIRQALHVCKLGEVLVVEVKLAQLPVGGNGSVAAELVAMSWESSSITRQTAS